MPAANSPIAAIRETCSRRSCAGRSLLTLAPNRRRRYVLLGMIRRKADESRRFGTQHATHCEKNWKDATVFALRFHLPSDANDMRDTCIGITS